MRLFLLGAAVTIGVALAACGSSKSTGGTSSTTSSSGSSSGSSSHASSSSGTSASSSSGAGGSTSDAGVNLACQTTLDYDAGGGGGAGGSATAVLMACTQYTAVPESEVSTFCDTDGGAQTIVASCNTSDILGACTGTQSGVSFVVYFPPSDDPNAAQAYCNKLDGSFSQ